MYEDVERLMTSTEVAEVFRVDPKTVSRWALAGRIETIRTPGGHRRYREYDVTALAAGHDLPERDRHGRVIEGHTDAAGNPASE